MRFGVSLCPEVGRYVEMREQALAAEDLGFDSAWLPEHHLMEGYAPSPLLGLAAIGALTERIQLGTDIAIIPFYHPVRLAEDVALLADMTGGRFVLGAGLGYRPEEFAAFGIPYEERGRVMQEGLEVIRRLLNEERVSHDGECFRLRDVTIYPRPRTPVPIYVGGWSRAALRRAAQLGDAWFPGPTADIPKVAACLADYDAALAELGRSRRELPIFRELWVADSPADLEKGVGPMRGLYVSDYLTWQHRNVQAGDAEDPFDDLKRDRFIVGAPDEVAAEIVRYQRELGMTHLVARLHFHGSDHHAVMKAMQLFAERVIPMVSAEVGSTS